VGIGTDTPEEMAHVVGTLLIDRSDGTTRSSLQFRHYEKIDAGSWSIPYYWDIFSDIYGLRFYTTSDGITEQKMIIGKGGSVGLGRGITLPQARLHVDQNILAEGNITTLNKFVLAPNNSNSEYWEISRSSTGLNYGYYNRILKNILFIDKDEVVKIDGFLCAKEVRVQLSGSPCWPDFVFHKDYKLLPLKEVEQFITENQHLPNVPSSAEVEANGVELGEMNAILLQKVEELTLYIIQMEKRLSELENEKGGK
jgi:hypothetical protein